MIQPIQPYIYNNNYNNKPYQNTQMPLPTQTIQMPQGDKNHIMVNPIKVDYFVKQKEEALPQIKQILSTSNNEAEITEALYITDRLIDNGTKDIDKMYPILSRFNNTNSPNIQTFLAGIYRKTQVPDAFGPLLAMLFRNSINPPQANFDPNEEIGGAILAYLSDRFREAPKESNVTNS